MQKCVAGMATVAIAVSLGACGDDNDDGSGGFKGEEKKVAVVVDYLSAASRSGDGERICNELFTRNLSTSVAKTSKKSCPDEITKKLFDEDARYNIDDIAVTGNKATVRVTDQVNRESVLQMVNENGAWKIAKIS